MGLGLIKPIASYLATQDAANVADENAQLADVAAGDATARGEEEASRIRGQTDRLIGQQRTGYAASGVAINEGSPLDVMVGSRAVSERDIATARLNGAREAWGYGRQADQFRRQASGDRNAALFNFAGDLVNVGTSTLLGSNDALGKVGG